MTAPTLSCPDRRDEQKNALVVIPTYNEAENVRVVIDRTLAAAPDVDILVVDDNSPDGTGRIAAGIARVDPAVHVLHRRGKEGLGAAYLDGFAWALAHDYPVVVEMDADGSHPPEQVPELIEALDDADLVLGSRWVPGGRVENWPRSRELLSRGGNAYVRRALGLPLKDATGGFRAFRSRTLQRIDLSTVESRGYCFQVDMARRVVDAGMDAVEVPITFREREAGVSKMTPGIVAEALWRVTRWAFRRHVPASAAVAG